MSGLIDQAGGLRFGSGLKWRSGLGNAGLDIISISLPTSGGLAPGFPGFASGWSATNVTLTTGISPDPSGGSNAARITEGATAGNHNISSTNLTITANGTYTMECFVKLGSSGTRNIALFLFDGSANWFGEVFNPSTGASVANNVGGGGSVSASNSAPSSNGFQKVWMTGSVGAGVTSVQAQVYLFSGTTQNYTGDNTSNDVIWGCSVVAGSTPP